MEMMHFLKLMIPAVTVLVVSFLSQRVDYRSSTESGDYHTYPEQLPGAYTGGFGEQTCHHCHFDYPLNDNPGWLQIEGLPRHFTTDSTYKIAVTTGRNELIRAGFQLTARFSDGKQAGRFTIDSENAEFTGFVSETVQYVQHSISGSIPSQNSDNAVWKFNWTAPAANNDTIYIHVSANAANGDASEFGDYIKTEEILVLPAE